MLGFLAVVARGPVEKLPQWLRPIASYIAPDVAAWIVWFVILGATIPLLDKAFGGWKFRKDKAQKVLDQMVSELLEGRADQHRVTLFRAVRGLRAWCIFAYRFWWQEEKRAALMAFPFVPWGLYLYVYVRPKRSWNPRSAAFFRVYKHKARDCEMFAGKVWQARGVRTVSADESFGPGSLRNIRGLDTYQEGDPVRTYSAATNVGSARQLRAREHYGKHFYGTVIEDGAGDRWGVLLLDSISDTCPIPENKKAYDKGAQFNERFDSFAQLLGTLMT
jgi:hypothetical protein